MDAFELRSRAGRLGVAQAVVEKDYALSVALRSLCEAGVSRWAVFKGGTALRKVYYPDARFSEDLDFAVDRGNKLEAVVFLQRGLENQERFGISFGRVESETTREGVKATVKFLGPLQHAQRVRVDFSFRSNLVLPAPTMPLQDEPGLSPASIRVLSLEEILAEKVHALCSRHAARDVYDIQWLVEHGVRSDLSVVERKFAYYGETFDAAAARDRLTAVRSFWSSDLGALLPVLPSFDVCQRVVGRYLETLERRPT